MDLLCVKLFDTTELNAARQTGDALIIFSW
jgi:hypothetical protein